MDDSAEDSDKVTVIVEPETPVATPKAADPEPPKTAEAPKVETKAKPREKPVDTPKEQVVDVDEYTLSPEVRPEQASWISQMQTMVSRLQEPETPPQPVTRLPEGQIMLFLPKGSATVCRLGANEAKTLKQIVAAYDSDLAQQPLSTSSTTSRPTRTKCSSASRRRTPRRRRRSRRS